MNCKPLVLFWLLACVINQFSLVVIIQKSNLFFKLVCNCQLKCGKSGQLILPGFPEGKSGSLAMLSNNGTKEVFTGQFFQHILSPDRLNSSDPSTLVTEAPKIMPLEVTGSTNKNNLAYLTWPNLTYPNLN